MGYVGTVVTYPHCDARFQVILASQDSVHISKDLKHLLSWFPGGTTVYKYGG